MMSRNVRRGRRGHPRHHRRLHPRARRRPDRRRRRHLLPRRRLRHAGHRHVRGPRRAPRGLRRLGAAEAPAPPRRATPSSPTGTTTRPPRSATWSSCSRAARAGRPSSWPATTTRSTTSTARGGSTAGRSSPDARPDMSWLGVLEHHASRTPDKPLAVFGDDVVTYSGMLDRAAAVAAGLQRAGRPCRRRRRAAVVQQHRLPDDDLRRQPPRRRRHADQLAARRRRGAATSSSTPQARALVCDGELLELADDATGRLDGDLVRVCIAADGADGWERFADLAATTAPPDRAHAEGDDLHRLMYTSGTTGARRA